MFTPIPDKFPHDTTYINNLREIRDNGVDTAMRNSTCRKVHGLVGRYNMSHGVPVMMHKKIFESFSKEMSWMTRGETNIKTLGCAIWDKWADADGELGPVYGEQMRKQVFFKLAADKTYIQKLIDADYVAFGEVLLSHEELTTEFGEDADRLIAENLVEACPEYIEEKVIRTKYRVKLFRKQVDQLDRAIKSLEKVNETGIADRRILISLWNNADYEMQALPPCHTIFHFVQLPISERERYEWACNALYIENKKYLDEMYGNADDPVMAIRDHVESEIYRMHVIYDPERFNRVEQEFTTAQVLDNLGAPKFKLDLVLFMRSNDYPAGAPFNIGGYAQVLIKMAQEVNMVPNELIHFASDAHIYEDQMEAVETIIDQYEEMVRTKDWKYPTVDLNDVSIKTMTHEDFKLLGYEHMPYVPVPVTE